jgi:hypothetical protein
MTRAPFLDFRRVKLRFFSVGARACDFSRQGGVFFSSDALKRKERHLANSDVIAIGASAGGATKVEPRIISTLSLGDSTVLRSLDSCG